MDTMIFDRLARACAYPSTRRSMVGAVAGLLVWRLGGDRVSAQETPQTTIPLGGACSVSSECSQVQGCYSAGPIICADNGTAEDGPLNCCLGEGGLCGNSAHCCGSLLCLDTGGDGCGAGLCQAASGDRPIDQCGLEDGFTCNAVNVTRGSMPVQP